VRSKPKQVAFRHGSLAFFAFPEHGAFFALTRKRHHVAPRVDSSGVAANSADSPPQVLVFCPMLADGRPDIEAIGPVEGDAVDPEVLTALNKFFWIEGQGR
jgi:hypothetical protein